jgi:hypothetical protein
VTKYIEIYLYDERLHCHDVTKLNDVARRQYISGALRSLLACLFLLATVMFPAAMPKFKGDQKISRNSAIFEQVFDISSPCRSE